MKKNLLILLMFTFTGTLFAQTKVESEKKTIKVENVELKTVKHENTKSVKFASAEDKNESQNISIGASNSESEKMDNNDANFKIENNETKNENTIEEQLMYYESLIKSIDKKVLVVKNDSVENERAKETGWFEQMESNRLTALNRIEELKKLKK